MYLYINTFIYIHIYNYVRLARSKFVRAPFFPIFNHAFKVPTWLT